MKKDYQKEFRTRKIKKPNALLARIVRFAFKCICKSRNVEFVYTEEYLKMKDRQAVYLCQHKSTLDYIYLFAGIKNLNAHVLCGYQNIFNKSLYKPLKHLGVHRQLQRYLPPATTMTSCPTHPMLLPRAIT